MTTPISVSITAVDQATKVFEQINANMERMQAPVKNLQRSFDRFSQLSGMNRLNEGFSRIRASATSAFRAMGQIAPVLGTITSAVTVAGITRLSTNWANFGSNLQTTSQRLGMSVSGLHGWQNGARLAGVSAETLTQSMESWQENIWNARGGRNPQFIATMNTLGVALNNVDGSARSAEAIMGDAANAIAKIKNPIAQATVATATFGSAGKALLPFLRQGSAGMTRYRQDASKYGLMNEAGARAADMLRKSQVRLTMSVEGFGYSLAQSIEPVLSPIITNMADWIAVNKEWVTQNVAGYVQQFSNYLKSINWQQVKAGAQQVWGSFKQFTETIQENIEKIGGFKTILGGAAALLGVKVVGSVMSAITPFASLAMTIGRVVVPAALSLLAAMGPVGWGIAAAGVIIGGAAMYIYKHWDTFKPYWESIWSAVQIIFDTYVKAVQVALKPFIGMFSIIKKSWEPLKNFFGGMLNNITGYFHNAFKYIGDIIDKICWAVKKVGSALGITKDAANEVSKAMQISAPTMYIPDVANDNDNNNGTSSKQSSWFGRWLPGGNKEQGAKENTDQPLNQVTDKIGSFFTSLTKQNEQVKSATTVTPSPLEQNASKVSAVSKPQHSPVEQTTSKVAASTIVPLPLEQNASKVSAVSKPQHSPVEQTTSKVAASTIVALPLEQQAQQGSKAAATPLYKNATLDGHIQKAIQGGQVSEAQMKALIMTESGGRMVGNATTSAYGYTQLTNAAAKDMKVNKYDPYENVLGGRKYYEQMLKKVGGNSIAAYGAYHDGGNSKGVKQFLASGGKDMSLFSKDAQKAMRNFQKYLDQANGGKIQFNQAIPQNLHNAPRGAIPNNIVTMKNMPNVSNIASVAPITANSGLGQLGGSGGIDIPSAPAVNLPMFENNNNSTPQTLMLEINIKGKPQGMDIKANSKSSNLTIEKIQYQRAMDPIQSASGF